MNNRGINRLMNGKTNTTAETGGVDDPNFSDAEISGLLEHEQEVLITVEKMKQDLVVLSFHV